MYWEEKYHKLIEEIVLLRDDMQYLIDKPHPFDKPDDIVTVICEEWRNAYNHVLTLAKEIGRKN